MEDIYSIDKFRVFRKKNLSDAIKDFYEKKDYIMKKINNIAENFDWDKDQIYEIIKNSKDEKLKELLIAVRLAKDPKRQNIYEFLFLDYMKKNGRNIKKLPSRGSKAVYLSKNELLEENSTDAETTKSLDYYERINDREYFYYHKFTESRGGAQANQYIDAKTFVRLSNKYCKNNSDNFSFIAVVDGPFYRDQEKDHLKSLAGAYLNKRIYILTWNTVLNTIN